MLFRSLDDFGIPLKLSHTVVGIDGRERLEGITLAKVDERGKPIPGTEEYYSCDTLLLSVGLIPEDELSNGIGIEMEPVTSGPIVNESLETSVEGIFACGNVLHVHDLVDYVSEEARTAGKNAAKYIRSEIDKSDQNQINLIATDGVRYTVPKYINVERMDDTLTVRFRVGSVYKNSFISVYYDGERMVHRKKAVMAPGEMEQIKLEKEKLKQYKELKNITVKIEEE